MLLNVLGLRDKRVEDIMVPRADIVALADDTALDEVMKGHAMRIATSQRYGSAVRYSAAYFSSGKTSPQAR